MHAFKTIERFGGRKGDLSRAVEEAVKTWVAKEKWMREQKRAGTIYIGRLFRFCVCLARTKTPPLFYL
jgi:hypothetical protein